MSFFEIILLCVALNGAIYAIVYIIEDICMSLFKKNHPEWGHNDHKTQYVGFIPEDFEEKRMVKSVPSYEGTEYGNRNRRIRMKGCSKLHPICICGHDHARHEDVDDGTIYGNWGAGKCTLCRCTYFECASCKELNRRHK